MGEAVSGESGCSAPLIRFRPREPPNQIPPPVRRGAYLPHIHHPGATEAVTGRQGSGTAGKGTPHHYPGGPHACLQLTLRPWVLAGGRGRSRLRHLRATGGFWAPRARGAGRPSRHAAGNTEPPGIRVLGGAGEEPAGLLPPRHHLAPASASPGEAGQLPRTGSAPDGAQHRRVFPPPCPAAPQQAPRSPPPRPAPGRGLTWVPPPPLPP